MRVIPLGLLRGCLALLGLFFAFMLGAAVAKYVNRELKSRVTGWAIRTILVLLAVSWRGGLDSFTILAWVLAAAGFGLGFALQNRPKKQEDLTDVIFPHDGSR